MDRKEASNWTETPPAYSVADSDVLAGPSNNFSTQNTTPSRPQNLPPRPRPPPNANNNYITQPNNSHNNANTKALPTSALIGELVKRTASEAQGMASTLLHTVADVIKPSAPKQTAAPNNNQQYIQAIPQPSYNPGPPITSNPVNPQYTKQYKYSDEANYWAILFSCNAWSLVFYYISFNLVWGVFCFAYTLTMTVVGIVLNIIFPLGFSWLFISAVSFRALMKAEIIINDALNPKLHLNPINQPVFIPSSYPGEESAYQIMKRNIQSWSTWGAAFYFIFYKLFSAITNFIFGVVALILSLTCVGPSFFRLLVSSSRCEANFARKCFSG